MVTFEQLKSIAHPNIPDGMIQELVTEINEHLNYARTEHVCRYIARMIGQRDRIGYLDNNWFCIDNGNMGARPSLMVNPHYGFKFGLYLEVLGSNPPITQNNSEDEEDEVTQPDDYREGCDCNDCRPWTEHRRNMSQTS